MEAAKKADRAFGVTPRSTKHTVADASNDITKIATHLLEQKVTIQMDRNIPFHDTIEEGFRKMKPAWLKQVLAQDSDCLLDQDLHNLHDTEQSEFIHELHDVM